MYGTEGQVAFQFVAGDREMVTSAAVDTDGTAAVAVEYHQRGEAHRIYVLDQKGATRRVIETANYLPANVSFAPDHSIWASGTVLGPNDAPQAEYEILRHYSLEGQELGRHWPKSLFPGPDPASPAIGRWRLRVAGDRVGAFFIPGGRAGLWVEGDLEGKVLGRWRVNPDAMPAAFAPDGSIYAQLGGGGVAKLDHGTGLWKPVAVSGAGVLIGAQGADLVFWQRGGNSLQWVAVQ